MPPNLRFDNTTAYKWLSEQVRQWLDLERELMAIWSEELEKLCPKPPS